MVCVGDEGRKTRGKSTRSFTMEMGMLTNKSAATDVASPSSRVRERVCVCEGSTDPCALRSFEAILRRTLRGRATHLPLDDVLCQSGAAYIQSPCELAGTT